MKHKTFSSLSHFSVGYMPGWLSNNRVATQLCTKQFPWLEHLGFGGPFEPSLAGRVPPNLTSPMLRLDDLGPSCTIQDLSLQKLTSLTLSGCADLLPLHPSSIQLPLLEKLVRKATDGDVLINAIMAPNLLHLEYSTGEWMVYQTTGGIFVLPNIPMSLTSPCLYVAYVAPTKWPVFNSPPFVTSLCTGVGFLCYSDQKTIQMVLCTGWILKP